MALNKETVKERQEHYQKRQVFLEQRLRTGKYSKEDVELQQRCDELNIKDKQRSSAPAPGGTVRRIEQRDPPGIMDKVRIELKKQDIKRPLDEKIELEATQSVLKEKQDEIKQYDDQETRKQLMQALELEKDQARIAALRKRQELTKQTDWKKTLTNARHKPRAKAQFNVRSEDRERTVNIEHEKQQWVYRKKGQEETLERKSKGKEMVVIRKKDKFRDFDEGKNAWIDRGEDQKPQPTYTLDEAVSKGADSPEIYPTSLSAAVPEDDKSKKTPSKSLEAFRQIVGRYARERSTDRSRDMERGND